LPFTGFTGKALIIAVDFMADVADITIIAITAASAWQRHTVA